MRLLRSTSSTPRTRVLVALTAACALLLPAGQAFAVPRAALSAAPAQRGIGQGPSAPARTRASARPATSSTTATALVAAAADQGTFSGQVSYSADALGQFGPGGSLRAEVPAGSTVLQASLYATYSNTTAPDVDQRTIVLGGTPVVTNQIGTAGTYLASTRADVTAQVAASVGGGGGTTSLVVGNDPAGLEGVALLVIYSNPVLPNASIAISDGGANQDGQRITFSFTDPLNKSTPGFSAEMSLGSAYGYQGVDGHGCGSVSQSSLVDVGGRRLTSCAGNYDDGQAANGALITLGGVGDSIDNPADPFQQPGDGGSPRVSDDELYDLGPFVASGQDTLTVDTSNPSRDDLLFLTVVKVTGRTVPKFVDRPLVETFGTAPGFGYASDPVNTATGNLTLDAVDLTSPLDLLTLSRTYNSLDPTGGPFGQGWSSRLVSQVLAASDGSVLFRAGDGRILTFTPDGAGGYTRPQDLAADLTRTASGWALRFGSGDVWDFGAGGWLTGIARDGENVLVERSGDRPIGLRHSSGASIALTYDLLGHLVTATASDGRIVRWTYADDGTLHTAVAPDGATTTYTSGAAGQLARITDAAGRLVVANTYDADGRVVHQDNPGGGGTDLRYDDVTGTTVVTSSVDGAQVLYRHDPNGRVVGMTDPDGRSLDRGYDAVGRLVSATDRTGAALARTWDARGNRTAEMWAGATTRWTYDDADRPTSTTDPTGGVTRFTYTGAARTPTTETDPVGGVTTTVVDGGLVRSVTTPEGRRTTYSWDAARRLVALTDPSGGVTRFGYDAAGHRTSVTSPLGATGTATYDAGGHRASTTDATGGTTRFGFDASGRLTTTTDPTGAVTRREYDGAGRLVRTLDPLGRASSSTYDRQGDLSQVADAAGSTSSFTHDALGRLDALTDPGGAVTTFEQDANGKPTTATTTDGATVTARDARGNTTAVTGPTGLVTRYAYDAADRPVSRTDPDGGMTLTRYDAAGRTIGVTAPDGTTTARSWTPDGLPASSTDELGRVTRSGYDSSGRLVTTTDPLGGVTRYTYDADGRRTSATSRTGLVTRYGYDANGRPTTVTDPRGGTTTTSYDGRGARISTTSPSAAVVRRTYDAAGQLAAVTDALGGVTRYAYDVAGNLTATTDAKGATSRYSYDAAGRETEATDPLGRITRSAYDAAGRPTTVADGAGKVLHLQYDALGRLIRRYADDGTSSTFAYDAAGRRTAMTDATGTTRYTYDALGRLLTTTRPDGRATTAAYDAAGHRSALTYPDGGTVRYGYDAAGRLTSATDPKAGAAAYALDADGRLLKETLPNGWSRAYAYTAGALTRFSEVRGSATTTTTTTRDADGRVITQTTGSATRRFTYDKAGQLLGATGQPYGSLTSTYDAVGNRTSVTRGSVTSRLTYDAADQLLGATTPAGTTAYSYDGAGRLLRVTGGGNEAAMTYDGTGQLQRVTAKDALATSTRTLAHDGNGLLVSLRTDRTVSGSTTSDVRGWVYGDGEVPQVLAQTGASAASFSYGYGRTWARTASASSPFSRDAAGSTMSTTATAPWAEATGYDAFGLPTTAPALDGAPRFGYRSELQVGPVSYLRARLYESVTGRFTSKDPLDGVVGAVGTMNPYLYGDNDPVNRIDPLGQRAVDDTGFELVDYSSDGCPDAGNAVTRHAKCFQGHVYGTRGYFPDPRCIDGNDDCLNNLWHAGQRERAAQGFTLHELDRRRQGFLDSLQDGLFSSTAISQNVDWEVGALQSYLGSFRIDIVTDEDSIFELKGYYPGAEAEVAAQLAGYVAAAGNDGVTFDPSSELGDWADHFHVSEGFWDFVSGGGTVYVWGYGNPDGHVYFAKDDKAPRRVRLKAEQDMYCFLCLPVPIEVPVPVVV